MSGSAIREYAYDISAALHFLIQPLKWIRAVHGLGAEITF